MARKISKFLGEPLGKCAILPLTVLITDAWHSLSSAAQALFPWLIMEFKGVKFNNNGKICLSVRQAAERMGVARDTAARAFLDLQAKGFIVVRKGGSLGTEGHGKCPEYEITSIATPTGPASHLYKEWSEGNDFTVFKHAVKNSKGKNKSLS
ncbi:MAG: hypothetical protein EBT51_07345 [Flavobacteriaceae bacterium]|nr:hypothetical protein [Flavobacteriaceae bacterium]